MISKYKWQVITKEAIQDSAVDIVELAKEDMQHSFGDGEVEFSEIVWNGAPDDRIPPVARQHMRVGDTLLRAVVKIPKET